MGTPTWLRRPVPVIAVTCAAALLASAPPAGARTSSTTELSTTEVPDVYVVATRFDQLVYQTGNTATVHFTFTNRAPVDAVRFAVNGGGSGDPSELRITDWGGLRYGEGITIPAGQTVTAVMRGTVPTASYDVGRVSVGFSFAAENGEADDSDNIGIARASVPGATGTTEGESFHDRNGNRVHDPGEGVAGVRITLVGLYDIERIVTTRTSEDGTFRLTDLPVGIYEMRVIPPPDWWLVYGNNVSHAEVRATEISHQVLEVEPR